MAFTYGGINYWIVFEHKKSPGIARPDKLRDVTNCYIYDRSDHIVTYGHVVRFAGDQPCKETARKRSLAAALWGAASKEFRSLAWSAYLNRKQKVA